MDESRDRFLQECAIRYVEDKAADLLRERGEAASAAEIAEELKIGKSLPMRLVRGILMSSSRFVQDGRAWRLAITGSESSMSTERVVVEMVRGRGRPVEPVSIAKELMTVRGGLDEKEALEIVTSMADVSNDLIVLADGKLAHESWILGLPTRDEEDVRLVNFRGESAHELDLFLEALGNGHKSADAVATVSSAIEKAGLPISTRVAAFLAWRKDPESFDPEEFLATLTAAKKLEVLSSGHWFSDKLLDEFEKAIKKYKVPEKLAAEMGTETRDGIEVMPRDIDEIERIIIEEERAMSGERALERYFDYAKSDAGYDKARATLTAALEKDGRFVKVGEDSYHIKELIPRFVFEIPTDLKYERVDVDVTEAMSEVAEIDVVDPVISEEGYEGSLKEDCVDPYVQDVSDCERPAKADSAGRARCLTKYHHTATGTLPLCQIPHGFFPGNSPLLHGIITVIDERAEERKKLMDLDVWVNRDTSLMFGLSKMYDQNLARSGQVFYFEPGSGPDNWRIVLTEDVDAEVALSPKRVAELEAMRTMAAEGPWSLFQIVREILTFHRSGASFARIMTEVSIVRRAKRQEVASILSSYHCFYPKGGQKMWNYDERKLSQGFKKSKRKYLLDEA